MHPGMLATGLVASVSLGLTAACGGDANEATSNTATLYTCVSDTTITPLIEEFESANPGSNIELFRAPTGELNARVAGDVRSGGLQADLVWTCDPLTMQDYVDQKLVGGWVPDNADAIPQDFRTDDYVGAGVLHMVAVHGRDVPAPKTWADLTGDAYAGGVAVPDPSFAASALGALGYFSQDPDYGLDFYAALEENGAVQVSTPDDVTTGVAEGVYSAGITIAQSAYLAKDNGSPVGVVAPEPGAIAIYSPVALSSEPGATQTAKDFFSYVLSEAGQTVIAENDASPTLPAVPGPILPEGTPTVSPDWADLAERTDTLLRDYQSIFGG